MVLLKNDFIASSVYNRLPFINDVHNEPDERLDELRDLKQILSKHKIPDTICIKLLHIHFELLDGEVMAFKNVDVPPHGEIETLGPHKVTPALELTGCHFFVDTDGNLQAFEYMQGEGPDMSAHQDFLAEYCRIITERGLQRVFGLSLRPDEQEQASWTELEYPQKRMTFNVPGGISLPDIPWIYVVTTRWSGEIVDVPTSHGHHIHHAHIPKTMRKCKAVGGPAPVDEGLWFGGTVLDVGTPFQQIYSSVIKAY